MLQTVGVSVEILRAKAVVNLCPSERGSIEVWTDSFGLFAGGGDEGMIDRLIAAAVAEGFIGVDSEAGWVCADGVGQVVF